MRLQIIENNVGSGLDESQLVFLLARDGNQLVLVEYTLSASAIPGAVDSAEALAEMPAAGPAPAIVFNGQSWARLGAVRWPSVTPLGMDEMCDYSLLDHYYGASNWGSRFPLTRNARARHTQRLRELQRVAIMATLAMPFSGDLSAAEMILYGRQANVITNVPVTAVHDAANLDQYPTNPVWWDAMWRPVITEVGRDGNSITFKAKLYWNRDDSRCVRPTTMWLDANAGYLPKREIVFGNDGIAVFSVMPMGLTAGDTIKVKLGAASFSGVGAIEVTV